MKPGDRKSTSLGVAHWRTVLVVSGVALAVLLTAYIALGEYFMKGGASAELTGDYGGAARDYDRARAVFGFFGKSAKRAAALRSLSSVYASLGRYDQALPVTIEIAAYEKARADRGVAEVSVYADALAQCAFQRMMLGQFEETDRLLREALRADPANPQAQYVTGLTEMQERNTEAALASFSSAIAEATKRKDPALGTYYLARAEGDAAIENYRRAQTDAELAMKAGLRDRKAWLLVVKSHVMLGEIELATTACASALKEFPEDTVLVSYLATINMINLKMAEAQRLFLGLISKGNSVSREAVFSLGVTYFCAGDCEQAKRSLIEAREVDPILSAVLLVMCNIATGSPNAKVLTDLGIQAEDLGNPRLLFYRDVFQRRYQWEALKKMLELRHVSFATTDAAKQAIEVVGVDPGVRLADISWEEVALVCGLSAKLAGEKTTAKEFFEEALDSRNYFYWSYIIAKSENAALGRK
ncbi:MAG: tetratricopeptide repeat protein [Candidatus Brocadiia bacterium]